MRRFYWLLALPYVVAHFTVNGKPSAVVTDEKGLVLFDCEQSLSSCEDFAEALNAAHERRTVKREWTDDDFSKIKGRIDDGPLEPHTVGITDGEVATDNWDMELPKAPVDTDSVQPLDWKGNDFPRRPESALQYRAPSGIVLGG